MNMHAYKIVGVFLCVALVMPYDKAAPENIDVTDVKSRIVGGEITRSVEHRWMVRVIVTDDGKQFQCGGTLIDKEWVLTAAHCVISRFDGKEINRDSIRLILGDYHRGLSDPGELEAEVDMVHSHHLYNEYSTKKKDHDVALLRLARPVKRSRWVKTIDIGDVPRPGTPMQIVGWGDTYFGSKAGSDYLRKAWVKNVDNRICYRTYPWRMGESMFCAGMPKGMPDTCQGDSGGPILYKRNGKFTQVGVTSWGDRCGVKGSYGVYSNLGHLMYWVSNPMGHWVGYRRQAGYGMLFRILGSNALLLPADRHTTSLGIKSWGTKVGETDWDKIIPGDFVSEAGVDDVLLYDKNTGAAQLYKSYGDGRTALIRTYTGWRQTWAEIVPGDYGGNGHTDLMFYDRKKGEGEIYLNDGEGRMSLLRKNTRWQRNWKSIVPGNFDDDSLTDLAFYGRQHGVWLYSIRKDGTLKYLSRYNTKNWSAKGWSIVSGNFGGDRSSDILMYNSVDGRAVIYINNGSGKLSHQYSYSKFPKGNAKISTGQFGGDGLTDLLINYPNQAKVILYIREGRNIFNKRNEYAMNRDHKFDAASGNFIKGNRSEYFTY